MNIFETKLAAVKEIADSHNSQNPENLIDLETFHKNLRSWGGTSDESLKLVTSDDLHTMGLPKLLARRVAEVFKKSEAPTDNSQLGNKSRYVSEKKVASLTIAQLVENYDPEEYDNPVGKRLAVMTRGCPCIAFDSNGNVIVSVSAKEVKALREGYDARNFVNANGVPTKLYCIGEKPCNLLDENPLYPGLPLRDGECDQTNRGWGEVKESVKQLLYLAVTKTGELVINQLKDTHDTLDLVLAKQVSGDEEKTIRSRFPQASLAFDELKAQNKLPSLKLPKKPSEKKNNPFGTHKSY